jgi:hypothetical protein
MIVKHAVRRLGNIEAMCMVFTLGPDIDGIRASEEDGPKFVPASQAKS